MIENSLENIDFRHSFLDMDMNLYMTFDTFSYILGEFQYSDLVKQDFFALGNPNIDTSVNV